MIVILLVVAGAAWIITAPLRGRARESDEQLEAQRAELDALREAKYREIRDAELDHAAGKLSDEDYAILDAELRKEAVEMLDELERAKNGGGAKAGVGVNGSNGANGSNGHHGNGNGAGPAAEPEKAERS